MKNLEKKLKYINLNKFKKVKFIENKEIINEINNYVELNENTEKLNFEDFFNEEFLEDISLKVKFSKVLIKKVNKYIKNNKEDIKDTFKLSNELKVYTVKKEKNKKNVIIYIILYL